MLNTKLSWKQGRRSIFLSEGAGDESEAPIGRNSED